MGDQKPIMQATSCFGRHLLLAPTALAIVSINLHRASVVGYGPFSLCVIHKEGLCSSSRHINKLMMMHLRFEIIFSEILQVPVFYQNDLAMRTADVTGGKPIAI
jgi:hypothetical protein